MCILPSSNGLLIISIEHTTDKQNSWIQTNLMNLMSQQTGRAGFFCQHCFKSDSWGKSILLCLRSLLNAKVQPRVSVNLSFASFFYSIHKIDKCHSKWKNVCLLCAWSFFFVQEFSLHSLEIAGKRVLKCFCINCSLLK